MADDDRSSDDTPPDQPSGARPRWENDPEHGDRASSDPGGEAAPEAADSDVTSEDHAARPDGGVPTAYDTGEILPSSAPAPVRRPTAIPKGALLGAILTVAIAGGAVAVVRSLGPSAPSDIASVVPADVIGFLRVSVEPSGDQRAALRRLLGKLPAARREDVTRSFDRALSQLLDSDEDFQRDVRPWLGPQIGFAAHAGTGTPALIGAIGVRDEEAARRFFQEKADESNVFEIVDGVAYLADQRAQITAFRDAAVRASLDGHESFTRALAAAGGDGLAVMWLNGDEVAKHADEIAGFFGGVQSIPGIDASKGSAVFVLRAEANGLAFVGHQSGGPEATTKPGRPRLLEGAPASVLGALSLFDLKGSFAQLGAAGAGNPLAAYTDLFGGVGLDLEDDILAWLGGEVTVLVTPLMEFGAIAQVTDERAYRRTVGTLLPVLGPRFGARVTTGPDGFTIVTDDVAIAIRKARGKVAIGVAQAASPARRLATRLLGGSGATLGKDDAYRAVIGAPNARTVFQAYVNLRQLGPFLRGQDALAVLEPFEAAAIRVTLTEGGSDIRLMLTLA